MFKIKNIRKLKQKCYKLKQKCYNLFKFKKRVFKFSNQEMKMFKLRIKEEEIEMFKKRRIYTKYGRVNYAIDLFPKKFWFKVWKPEWASERGYYISISLYVISIFRGY